MNTKIQNLSKALEIGQQVEDPAKVKNNAILVNIVVPIVTTAVVIANSFGVPIPPIPAEIIVAVGTAIFSAFNIIAQVISSDKVGMKSSG